MVLVFDELTYRQAAMHYSRRCLTSSVAYVTIRLRMRQRMTSGLAKN